MYGAKNEQGARTKSHTNATPYFRRPLHYWRCCGGRVLRERQGWVVAVRNGNPPVRVASSLCFASINSALIGIGPSISDQRRHSGGSSFRFGGNSLSLLFLMSAPMLGYCHILRCWREYPANHCISHLLLKLSVRPNVGQKCLAASLSCQLSGTTVTYRGITYSLSSNR